MKNLHVAVLCGVTLVAVGSPVGAQGSSDGAFAQDPVIEEVLVTAQRREERLIDVPVSVSAISASVLEKIGASDITRLENIVPSLIYVNSGTAPRVSIRGIGLHDFSSVNESPIALYVNDVYLTSSLAAWSQNFDVSRVEVLRGPQGTLFGRNATGGLIQIITNKPTADARGNASLQYGSYNQVIGEAVQNIPLSDAIRTRAAVQFSRDDGYQVNPDTGTRFAKTDSISFRGTVDVDISASITNSLIAHYGRDNGTANISAFRGTRDPNNLSLLCSPERIVANECVTEQGERNANPNGRHVFSTREDSRDYLRSWGVNNTLTYLATAFNFTSITAYQSITQDQRGDAGGTPDPFWYTSVQSTRKQLSQEFRFDGEFGDSFRWVAGAYYLHDSLPDGFIGVPNITAAFGTTLGTQNDYTQKLDSSSAYGQADYEILPNLTFTAGVRYTYEDKKLVISDSFANPSYIDTFSPTSSRTTWKAALTWHIQENLMAYGSVATGYKSSGFNTSLVTQNRAAPADPETNTNFEIGIKGQTNDQRWQGGLTAFYTDYRDFQLVTLAPGSPVSLLVNVPKAPIYGVEAETTARPIDGLWITGNITVTDSEIDAPGFLLQGVPLDGSPLPATPKFTAKGIFQYDLEVSSAGTISPWFTLNYRTSAYAKLPELLLNEMKGYTLVDAGITWLSPNGQWKLDLLVENALDKSYPTNTNLFANMSFVRFGKQRTFAVKLSTNW